MRLGFDKTVVCRVIGGTRERWNRWYARAIPKADQLYRRYLEGLEDER